jgi:hypothetical protein
MAVVVCTIAHVLHAVYKPWGEGTQTYVTRVSCPGARLLLHLLLMAFASLPLCTPPGIQLSMPCIAIPLFSL